MWATLVPFSSLLSCPSGRSGWAFWSPATSWIGLAGFMLFSVEQEAFSSFSLQSCISGHLFTVILSPHFSLQGVMLGPSCPGQGLVAVPGYPLLGSTLAHCSHLPSWLSASPDFPQETLLTCPCLLCQCQLCPVAAQVPQQKGLCCLPWCRAHPDEQCGDIRLSLYERFPPVKSVHTSLKGPCDHGHVASITPAITQGAHLCLQGVLLSCQLLHF